MDDDAIPQGERNIPSESPATAKEQKPLGSGSKTAGRGNRSTSNGNKGNKNRRHFAQKVPGQTIVKRGRHSGGGPIDEGEKVENIGGNNGLFGETNQAATGATGAEKLCKNNGEVNKKTGVKERPSSGFDHIPLWVHGGGARKTEQTTKLKC